MPFSPLHNLIVRTAATLYARGRKHTHTHTHTHIHTHTHTHTLTQEVSKVQLSLQDSVLQVTGSKKSLTNYMR